MLASDGRRAALQAAVRKRDVITPTFANHRTLVVGLDRKPHTFPLLTLNGPETVKALLLGRLRPLEWSGTYAHGVHQQHDMLLPSVMQLLEPVSVVGLRQLATFNLRNLCLRDRFTCQYTGERLHMVHEDPGHRASFDHVLPRSRGGEDCWSNAVLASATVNNHKGARTPEEAGLRLIHQPWMPTCGDLLSLWLTSETLQSVDAGWLEFLHKVKPSGRVKRVLDLAA